MKDQVLQSHMQLSETHDGGRLAWGGSAIVVCQS